MTRPRTPPAAMAAADTPAQPTGTAGYSHPVGAGAPPEVLAEAAKWVQVGRALAIEQFPYLDLALSSMIPVAVVGLGTVATDKRWRFYYDPQRVMAEPEGRRRKLLVSDWIHEVGHHLRDHASRWEQMGHPAALHSTYNTAGDAIINADAAEMGLLILPTDVTFDRLPGELDRGMTTEQIYARLVADLPPDPGQPAGEGVPVPVPDCGSGAGGPQRPWERPSGDSPADDTAGGAAEGPAADGSVDEGRGELIRQETAAQIQQHARSQGSGHLPHGLREWSKQYLQPSVDWRQELRSAVSRTLGRAAGRFDYTWQRPARRRIPGYTTPGMAAPEPPTAAVVVDTSGSMSPDDLAQAIADIASLSRAAGSGSHRAPVRVIPCDTSVGEVQPVRTPADIRRLQLTGGGGTNMEAGLNRAAELRPTPQVVVTITDGYTPWPDQPPAQTRHTPHIAVIVRTADAPAPSGAPDWMHVIDAPIGGGTSGVRRGRGGRGRGGSTRPRGSGSAGR